MTPPIPPILDTALGFNLDRVARLLRRSFGLELKGMTPEQWVVLAALWHAQAPLRQVELCELTLKDVPAMSRLLGRMEKQGWIERLPDPNDKRAWRVRATPKGEAQKARIHTQLDAFLPGVISPLTNQEVKTLLELLRKMRNHLEHTLNERPK